MVDGRGAGTALRGVKLYGMVRGEGAACRPAMYLDRWGSGARRRSWLQRQRRPSAGGREESAPHGRARPSGGGEGTQRGGEPLCARRRRPRRPPSPSLPPPRLTGAVAHTSLATNGAFRQHHAARTGGCTPTALVCARLALPPYVLWDAGHCRAIPQISLWSSLLISPLIFHLF